MKTPISNKHNLSLENLNNDSLTNIKSFIYDLGLTLDKTIPIFGYTNQQRIEIAINTYNNFKSKEKEILEYIKNMELCAPRLSGRFDKLREMLKIENIETNNTTKHKINIHNKLPHFINGNRIKSWSNLYQYLIDNKIEDLENVSSFYIENDERIISINEDDYVYYINLNYLIKATHIEDKIFEKENFNIENKKFNDNSFLKIYTITLLMEFFKNINIKELTYEELYGYFNNELYYHKYKNYFISYFNIPEKHKFTIDEITEITFNVLNNPNIIK